MIKYRQAYLLIALRLCLGRDETDLGFSDVSLVPSFVGGAFHTPTTIIIAYFYICNNNFHIAKLNFLIPVRTYDHADSGTPPKVMTFRPAMESQARNGNASQAQRASRDNPKKL